MKYYVNYGTGAGNEEIEGTLEDAMRVAEEGLTFSNVLNILLITVGLRIYLGTALLPRKMML